MGGVWKDEVDVKAVGGGRFVLGEILVNHGRAVSSVLLVCVSGGRQVGVVDQGKVFIQF